MLGDGTIHFEAEDYSGGFSAQSGVEKMGRRVVATDGIPRSPVDVGRHEVGGPQAPRLDPHGVHARTRCAEAAHGHHGGGAGLARHAARVGHLAAGFDIKGCAFEHEISRRTLTQFVDLVAFRIEERHDAGVGDLKRAVSLELIGNAGE